ncbi:hypothetical protein LEMLEM_LOCUS1796, partial [Lemmus lemmus]
RKPFVFLTELSTSSFSWYLCWLRPAFKEVMKDGVRNSQKQPCSVPLRTIMCSVDKITDNEVKASTNYPFG